jgi:hypothetical protein
MPNWCENELIVVGDERDVLAFVKENRGSEEQPDGSLPAISFNAKVPQPEDIGEGWYDWCSSNWGCKWEPNDDANCVIADNGESAEYWLVTPWGPPEPWLVSVSKLYPSLRFQLRWIEEDEQVLHTYFYRNGSEISSDEFAEFAPLIRIENAEKVTF